jgi:hypothetical protein
VATAAFMPLAQIEARAWGWEVPVARIDHPLGGVPSDRLDSRAQQVVDFFVEQANGAATTRGGTVEVAAEPIIAVPADPWYFYDFIQGKGWGDGFPVLHPTPDRVQKMLAAAGVEADAFIGLIPPEKHHVTAQDVAANAVMAGLPDHAFPVVLGAIKAALQERFNLLGVLATTNPCATAIIVSGQIARELGMNAGASVYGPGNRMNAAIGRTVRLALQNLGGAWPGPVDKSTQGSPAKYAYCFAENLEESPWGAYHVERGFKDSDSTVSIVAPEGPHNMHDPASTSGGNFLQYVIGSMTHCGHNNLYHLGDLFLVLCPEHAQMLVRDGYDRPRIRQEIFERARVAGKVMGREAFDHFLRSWPDKDSMDFETSTLPICATPEEIHIVVAGGPGKHSSWLPTFGLTYSAIEKLG